MKRIDYLLAATLTALVLLIVVSVGYMAGLGWMILVPILVPAGAAVLCWAIVRGLKKIAGLDSPKPLKPPRKLREAAPKQKPPKQPKQKPIYIRGIGESRWF